MASVLVWADIPVKDMGRARKFYGELLQVEVMEMPGSGGEVAIPPRESGPIAFDLAGGPGQTPTTDGVCIYFDAGDDIDGMVERARSAGATVLQPPRDMGPMIGVIAFIVDTEGNRIGLRAPGSHE